MVIQVLGKALSSNMVVISIGGVAAIVTASTVATIVSKTVSLAIIII